MSIWGALGALFEG